MNYDIPVSLFGLARWVRDTVKNAAERGKLPRGTELYVVPEISDFAYTNGHAAYRCQESIHRRTTFGPAEFQTFFDECIAHEKLFNDTVAIVETVYPSARDRLHGYVRFVAHRAERETLSDGVLAGLVASFVAYLDRGPAEIRLVGWLDGISLDLIALLLAPQWHLRQPKASDFSAERPLWPLELLNLTGRVLWNPSAILEFSMRTTSPHLAQDEFQRLLNILSLYRLGSVIAPKVIFGPSNNFMPGVNGGTMYGPGFEQARYRYTVRRDDDEPLRQFVARMKPLVPVYDPSQSHYLNIAVKRYEDALVRPGVIDSSTTEAITCLEALLLRAQERAELSHRLSQRVAALISGIGLGSGRDVYTRMGRAYEIRSAHVHGGVAEGDQQKKAQLAHDVTNYARIALAAMIQLEKTTPKDDLISSLDNSLLEPKAAERLKKRLKDVFLPGDRRESSGDDDSPSAT